MTDRPECAVGRLASRAAEIALSGGHRIGLLAVGARDEAEWLAAAIEHAGGSATVLLPCPCGNLGAVQAACECSPRRCTGWTRKPSVRARALDCQLIIEMHRPSAIDHASEPWSAVLARVAVQRPEAERARGINATVDLHAYRLATQWQERVHPPVRVFQNMQHVARTIAAMEGAYVGCDNDGRLATIGAHHVAEAVCYLTSEFTRRVWS